MQFHPNQRAKQACYKSSIDGPGAAPVLVGLVMLAAAGAGYRAVAARYAWIGAAEASGTSRVYELPLEIGSWLGQDVPVEDDPVFQVETRVSREYVHGETAESVVLSIQEAPRSRDLVPHRPEVCYPGAGWTLRETRPIEAATMDGGALPCQLYRFDRGGLESRSVAVLHWYVLGGEYVSGAASLRSTAWMSNAASESLLQVQICSYANAWSTPDEEGLLAFARELAPQIAKLVHRTDTPNERR